MTLLKSWNTQLNVEIKFDDSFFKNKVEKIHDYVSENLDSIKGKLRKFREDIAKFRYWQSRLGSVRN